MRLKIARIAAVVVLLVLVSLGFFYFKIKERRANLDELTIIEMQRKTGIEIPAGAKVINQFSGNLWGEIVKFKLDAKDIDDLIEKHKMYEVFHVSDVKLIQLRDIENDWDEQMTFKTNDCYAFSDTLGEKDVCNILVRKGTNELWYELVYSEKN